MDKEAWEIVRIVGKRRRGKGYGYKVCWKETWLLERELGNAQELLRKFEAKHQAQRGGKRGRPARADKGRRSLIAGFRVSGTAKVMRYEDIVEAEKRRDAKAKAAPSLEQQKRVPERNRGQPLSQEKEVTEFEIHKLGLDSYCSVLQGLGTCY